MKNAKTSLFASLTLISFLEFLWPVVGVVSYKTYEVRRRFESLQNGMTLVEALEILEFENVGNAQQEIHIMSRKVLVERGEIAGQKVGIRINDNGLFPATHVSITIDNDHTVKGKELREPTFGETLTKWYKVAVTMTAEARRILHTWGIVTNFRDKERGRR
jgi:hypothetical protein